MWQRFTESARKVVFFAQEEAQKAGSGYVSTEHLLLGLVREPDSVAFRVLNKLNVSAEMIRTEVEKSLPEGDGIRNHEMTLTPRSKRVIDLAYDEARNLQNTYIGTEHLLLGLIREGDGLAGKVLAKLGVEFEQARQEVRLLQDNDSSGISEAPPAHPSGPTESLLKFPVSAAVEYAVEQARLFVSCYEGSKPEVHPRHIVYAIFNDPPLSLESILDALDRDADDVAAAILTTCNLAEAKQAKNAKLHKGSVDMFLAAAVDRSPADTLAIVAMAWTMDMALGDVLQEALGCDLPAFREKVKAFWDANPSE